MTPLIVASGVGGTLALMAAGVLAVRLRRSPRVAARSLAARGVPVRLIAARVSLPQDVVRMLVAGAAAPALGKSVPPAAKSAARPERTLPDGAPTAAAILMPLRMLRHR